MSAPFLFGSLFRLSFISSSIPEPKLTDGLCSVAGGTSLRLMTGVSPIVLMSITSGSIFIMFNLELIILSNPQLNIFNVLRVPNQGS